MIIEDEDMREVIFSTATSDDEETDYYINELGPRPPFLTAADYVFYLKRQVEKERYGSNAADNRSAREDEAVAIELPKLADLLRRLREDLKSSFVSFVDDFVREPQDGVSCLLDLLRLTHNRQMAREPYRSLRNRERQELTKKVVAEEYDCLLCLKYSTRSGKAMSRIVEHRSGLTSLASCFVSSLSKSRLISLELLTKACDVQPNGPTKVLEAMTSIRLIFGESCRFKLLVGMINSRSVAPSGCEKAALVFLNTLLSKITSPSERVRLQCELQEAGLDMDFLEKKLLEMGIPRDDDVWCEMDKWKQSFLDVGEILSERLQLARDNVKMHDEVELLRKSMRKLDEDKISLMQIERELKEKCEDLEQELNSLKRYVEEIKGKMVKSDLSDTSDRTATDSGRWSPCGEDGVQFHDHDQPKNEDIFIYVPALHPPADDDFLHGNDTYEAKKINVVSDSEHNDQEKQNHNGNNTNATSGRKSSLGEGGIDAVDSALDDTDSDCQVATSWPQYPIVSHRSASTLPRAASVERNTEGGRGTPARDPSPHSTKSQRCHSRQSGGLEYKEHRKSETSSEFFFRTRENNAYYFSYKDPPSKSPPYREPPQTYPKPSQIHSCFPRQPATKMFPIPANYKNNFIRPSHTNCSRYSGNVINNNFDKYNPNVSGLPDVPPHSVQRVAVSPPKDHNLHQFHHQQRLFQGYAQKPPLPPRYQQHPPYQQPVHHPAPTSSSYPPYYGQLFQNDYRQQERVTPPNVALPYKTVSTSTDTLLVHKEITEAVREIGGWV